MRKPGDYLEMKRALIAALLHHGGQIEIDFTDLGEAVLSDLDVIIERTANGAAIRVDKAGIVSRPLPS